MTPSAGDYEFLSQGKAKNWMTGLGLVEYPWGWGLMESPFNWVSCDHHAPVETEQASKILLEFTGGSPLGIYDPLEPLRRKRASRASKKDRYRRFVSSFPECGSPQFCGLLKVGADTAPLAIRSVLELHENQGCNLHLIWKDQRTLVVFCDDGGFHVSASTEGQVQRFVSIFESEARRG
jgi:hypothetical protein